MSIERGQPDKDTSLSLQVPSNLGELVSQKPEVALAASFTAEENFFQAAQEASRMESPSSRVKAYLVIAEGLMLAGRNPLSEIRLVHSSLKELRSDLAEKYKPYQSDRKEGALDTASTNYTRVAVAVADTMVDFVNLTLRRNDGSSNTAISELYDHLNTLTYSPSRDAAKDTARPDGGNWIGRRAVQIEQLARLAEIIIRNPEATGISVQEIVTQMNNLTNEPLLVELTKQFNRESFRDSWGVMLSILARTQVFAGDLNGAEATLASLKQVTTKRDPNLQPDAYDSLEHFRHSKIKGLSVVAALQNKVGDFATLENISPEQIEEILSSGNSTAITALGYNGLVNLEEILERENISQEVKDHLLAGVEKRLAAEEQKIAKQRLFIASKRKEIQ